MRCIAVDDEPFALELIAGYIRKTPSLQCVGEFTNPFEAMAFLVSTSVDLVFLDINMPELSGMELLKSLPVIPNIVFTTAYSEFGAESYEFNAVDFLLKPVKYERFLKAVNKASSYPLTPKGSTALAQPVEMPSESILVKSGTKKFRIATDDIFYIEGAGNYITFHTKTGKITTLLPLNDVLKMLSSASFVRIHKSYIVSLKHVGVVERASVIVHNRPIPIGITYREQFSKIIQSS
ncbi:LytR/AlgR family response regulator transcription factor [Hymenobacter lucidus]|uniref:LytTR family DNA-binding domain-containing protein n=1 Tax=Hymenobacter lucidus TaxID=2880930 RepID=A0ABS8AR26_9BACT|nr:LytTR family DNA-binding domain-containing protein [Hymenobacter lucidus]MCB2408463.1 LytTR family DNA-binding domain-containing protein [Hymenobacter lucidus]